MTKTKSLLQEAIAEAKQVREAAITNAYKQLEESLTPTIKEMIASKLEENEDVVDDSNEEELQETVNSGFTEVKPKKAKVNEAEEEDEESDENAEESDEAADAEAAEEEPKAEEEPDGDEDGGEANGDHEEPDGDEPEEANEVPSDDTKIEDLTFGDLKTLMSDLVSQMSAPAPAGDLGADMDAGDVEGMGDEEAPLDSAEPEMEEPAAGAEAEQEPEEDNDEEIDLSELLKELEAEEKDRKVVSHSQDSEEMAQLRKENKEFKETIKQLSEAMADINLLNAKLSYTTRMLSTKTLSESQKAKVIKAFDEAKSAKEVKVIFKTLNESIESASKKKPVIKENRGSASAAAGKSTAKVLTEGIVEVDPMVRRFQQLAGILD